jgi:hypothetical protein
MDAIRALLFKHMHAAWRRRWMGVTVAWMVCGAGWVLVYAIPNQFESTARMFVDADAVLTPLLRGLAADSAPTTQLEFCNALCSAGRTWKSWCRKPTLS